MKGHKFTNTEVLLAGLEVQKCAELPSPSRKYRQFERQQDYTDRSHYYWLGKAGALRIGRISSDTFAAPESLMRSIALSGLRRLLSCDLREALRRSGFYTPEQAERMAVAHEGALAFRATVRADLRAQNAQLASWEGEGGRPGGLATAIVTRERIREVHQEAIQAAGLAVAERPIHKHEFTQAELEEAGACRACQEKVDRIEPDARGLRCASCGANEVYGAEELMLMGEAKIV